MVKIFFLLSIIVAIASAWQSDLSDEDVAKEASLAIGVVILWILLPTIIFCCICIACLKCCCGSRSVENHITVVGNPVYSNV